MVQPTSPSALLYLAAFILAVPSTLVSAVDAPFGKVIRSCTQPNTFALTFDDGPHDLTPTLLETLKDNNFKATFFINGNNHGFEVKNQGALLTQMLAEGHQICSHTFDHADLQKLSPDEIRSQMARLDQVLDETIGMRPTFMRPPYYSISPEVLKVLEEMQYHVVHSDIDTNDWKYNRIRNRGKALHLLKSGLQKGGSIVLMHDIHNTTVNWLVPKAVPFLRESGKRFVTVGECLGVPREKWYRQSSVSGPETMTLPAASPPDALDMCSYTVVAGDSCWKISIESSISSSLLRQLNPGLDTDCSLFPGDVLNVPCKEG